MIDEVTNATDAQKAYGASGSYSASWRPRQNDANKFAAESQNDWAMALFNRDVEQAQWLRNINYNDPSNEYARLVNAGINPLLAAKAVAGDGSQASSSGLPSGSASARAGNGSEMAAAAKMSNAVNAAGNVANAVGQFADARLKNMEADAYPATIRTQQDLNRAQAYLAKQNADAVPTITRSASNANDARAKMDAASAAMNEQNRKLLEQMTERQRKELNWFQTDKVWQYEKMSAEISHMFADVRHKLAQIPYYTNAAQAQRALAGLYKDESFNRQLQAVGQRIQNMSQQTGIPLNIAGGALLYNMDNKAAFDQFGKWKGGMPFDENDQNYKNYMLMQHFDYGNMRSAYQIGQRTAEQFYWDRVYRGIDAASGLINSASGAVNAASGYKNAFNPAVRSTISHNTNINFRE